MLLRLLAFTIIVSLGAVAGCGRETGSKKDEILDVKGTVVRVDAAENKVELNHEKIGTDYMEAMTMWFKVEDRKMLEGLKEGDKVHGRLKVYDGRKKSIITELRKQ